MLVVWRGKDQRATITGRLWNGQPTPVQDLADYYRGGVAWVDGQYVEKPARWEAASDLRPCDRARIERAAAKAPAYYSAKGRGIRGDESIEEGRARRERQRRESAEAMCHFRVSTHYTCCRRDVVACDIRTKLGRCAEHVAGPLYRKSDRRVPECTHCQGSLANGSDKLCAGCRIGLRAPAPEERR